MGRRDIARIGKDGEVTTIEDVRRYWETHPLCAAEIPYPPGSRDFFEYYDRLREIIETQAFSDRLHEYGQFSGRRVLDVGCGNGYVLSRYSRAGAEVYGVDVTNTAVKLSRARFAYARRNGEFVVGNAEALPFDDEAFDCVCSMGVLHHTPDTARAISEIYRVLRPGGRLIVMFYHRNSAQYRVRYPLIRLVTGKSLKQLVDEYDGVGNPKGEVFSKAQLRGLLSAFEHLEIFAGYLRGGMLLPKVGRFIPQLFLRPFERTCGWNLYAKAFKPAS